MVRIGSYNTLEVMRHASGGFVLDARDPVFLPANEAPPGLDVGQRLRVFVYTDSAGMLVGSTREAKAGVGEFAFLRCVEVSEYGAFLDWGIPKDLFVPFAQQHKRMVAGESYVVAVCMDPRVARPMASSKLAKFFDYDLSDLDVGEAYDLLVFAHNDAGAQVVVDQRYVGLIYTDATFRPLPVGLELTGYIAALRGDNRLDISLTRPRDARDARDERDEREDGERRGGRDEAQLAILEALRRAGGFLAIHDKSSPELIQQRLAMSKKLFKRSVGALYKARLIRIEQDGLHLAAELDASD